MTFTAPKGTLNFRAVAPYRAANGQDLRRDRLFRSGTLENIGPEGGQKLCDLGIASVFDLRADNEVAHHPAPLEGTPAISVIAPRHRIHLGELGRVIHDPTTRQADVRAAMVAVYQQLPQKFAPIFAQVLSHAAAAEAPFVINCTAGKDRTGTAVALILSALGVSRAAIFADYLESNAAGAQLRDLLRSARGGIRYDQLSEAVIAPLHAADPDYLTAFFDVIDRRFGGVEGYLDSALGVTQDHRAALRLRLLE